MKTLPAMLGAGALFWDLFLIVHLGLWSIHGEESCRLQLYIKRHSEYFVTAGQFFKMECPVTYCVNRPNITWCKFSGMQCLPLEDRHQLHTSWEERLNVSVFILHFNPITPSDNGSYSCHASSSQQAINSHIIAIHVTEQMQNNSERPVIILPNIPDATSVSGPPSRDKPADGQCLFYILLPLGALLLLIITCFCLVHFLKRHQGKEKKPSDVAGRELNLIDIPQPFENEQIEASPRKNSQTLPLEMGISDNDPSFRLQEGPEVYSNSQLEGNKQGVIYASLNHSIIGRNPRQTSKVQEAPTEYASICVRS